MPSSSVSLKQGCQALPLVVFFGQPSAFWFGGGEHKQCEPVCKIYSTEQVQPTIITQISQQNEDNSTSPCRASSLLLKIDHHITGIERLYRKLAKVSCYVHYPQWNRNVRDFMLCFTVSLTPSLRNDDIKDRYLDI